MAAIPIGFCGRSHARHVIDRYGEGITVQTIAGLKLPCEVGAPHIIGCEEQAAELAGVTDTPTVP
jgi:hypothetical protein